MSPKRFSILIFTQIITVKSCVWLEFFAFKEKSTWKKNIFMKKLTCTKNFRHKYGKVAQLVRAHGSYPWGREFESLPCYFFIPFGVKMAYPRPARHIDRLLIIVTIIYIRQTAFALDEKLYYTCAWIGLLVERKSIFQIQDIRSWYENSSDQQQ